MSQGPAYLLDANVFITAAQNYYAFDLAPFFWDKLIDSARAGRICSIDKVKLELDRQEDPLSNWANKNANLLFVTTDEDKVIEQYRHLMQWAMSQKQYLQCFWAFVVSPQ